MTLRWRLRRKERRTYIVFQELRLCISIARGLGSIPSQGTKILWAVGTVRKKERDGRPFPMDGKPSVCNILLFPHHVSWTVHSLQAKIRTVSYTTSFIIPILLLGIV